MTITHYRSSDGRSTRISDMHDAHLANAIAKLAKSHRDASMLAALKHEATQRTGRAQDAKPKTMSGAEAYMKVFGGQR